MAPTRCYPQHGSQWPCFPASQSPAGSLGSSSSRARALLPQQWTRAVGSRCPRPVPGLDLLTPPGRAPSAAAPPALGPQLPALSLPPGVCLCLAAAESALCFGFHRSYKSDQQATKRSRPVGRAYGLDQSFPGQQGAPHVAACGVHSLLVTKHQLRRGGKGSGLQSPALGATH